MSLTTQCQECATCQSKVCSFAGGQVPNTTQLNNLFGNTTQTFGTLDAPQPVKFKPRHDASLDAYLADLDQGW